MIYIASKTKHSAKWRELKLQGAPINSTWIFEAGPGETKSFEELWHRNIDQACIASVLIAYLEPGEVPKGALVEIGAALATGGPVYLVGFNDPQWTFGKHPQVTHCHNLDQAFTLAGKYSHSCKWKHYR